MEWEARIISDWQASLGVLQKIWQDSGGFDAILGFSNGAAARYCVLIRRGGEGPVGLVLDPYGLQPTAVVWRAQKQHAV